MTREPITITDAEDTGPLLASLRAEAAAFRPSRDAVFEGLESRFAAIGATEAAAAPRRHLAEMAGAEVAADAEFWRFSWGDYVLPTEWLGDGGGDLRIWMLNASPADALIVSLRGGARSFTQRAGRALTIRRPCQFWLGPTHADDLYLAVAGRHPGGAAKRVA
ncbi:MAG: hypothetical protein OXR84_15030 [Magnetovibrio sp.]|nr:hypothetical protein [Magnetovibrio sp.]